jgi:hypothetical protein
MTTAINYQTLSQELNTTAKRVETIFSTLFGDFEATEEQVKPHVKAVLDLVKSKGLTVPDACDTYRLEVQKKQQQQGSKSSFKTPDKPGEGSLTAILENDRKTTKKLAVKRYTAIVTESNKLLARMLTEGITEEDFTEELENAIFDSSDLVLDAMTECIDITGEYSYPQALKPSERSIAHLLMPSQEKPTPSISTSNGKH